MLLSLKDVVVHYGKLEALSGISMEVEEGEIVSILGANGAGKSTTLKVISGLKKPTSGGIWFDGQRIDGVSTARVVSKGIAQVPEGRRLFRDMPVWENLIMGAYTRTRSKKEINRDLEETYQRFPALEARIRLRAGQLSGGEQSMLSIARALMARPRLLLMDEPTQGLAPQVVDEIEDIIRSLNKKGMTIVLVEQNVQLAVGLASRVYILEGGKVSLKGAPTDMSVTQYVQKVYLAA